MATKAVTDDTFDSEVLSSSGPVLVDFWAEWCPPCKAIAPALEQISDELAGQVTIVKLNTEDSPETPSKYGVMNIPTLIMFKDGERVATKVGGDLKSRLKTWIEEQL